MSKFTSSSISWVCLIVRSSCSEGVSEVVTIEEGVVGSSCVGGDGGGVVVGGSIFNYYSKWRKLM